jgi:hypothetical protein
MGISLSRFVMKLMIIFHVVSSVTGFRQFYSTFKCIHCGTVLNWRIFFKIMLPIY